PASVAFMLPEEIDSLPNSPISLKFAEPEVSWAFNFPAILEALRLPLEELKSNPPCTFSIVIDPEESVEVPHPAISFTSKLPEEPLRYKSPSIMDASTLPELTVKWVSFEFTFTTFTLPDEFIICNSISTGPLMRTYLF